MKTNRYTTLLSAQGLNLKYKRYVGIISKSRLPTKSAQAKLENSYQLIADCYNADR